MRIIYYISVVFVILFLPMMAYGLEKNDSMSLNMKPATEKSGFFKRLGNSLYNVVKSFNDIDTAYIEPQHYNYTVMLQNTTTYDVYRIKDKQGQSMVFAPNPSIKLGPYIGWRWIFLGYAVDFTHMHSDAKQELDLSLYSSTIGIDLFFRQTGDNYKVRAADFGRSINTRPLIGLSFSGLSVSTRGFNLYYISNHKRFSYPAAFNQSTCQKLSCGSPIFGIGYTHHSLSLDYAKLSDFLSTNLPTDNIEMDSSLTFNKIKYADYTIYGGYAYNWVLAKNLLFASSFCVGLAYSSSRGDVEKKTHSFRDFSFDNINLNGLGRFGMVWNNTRWYAGWSAIVHGYTYRKRRRFSTNNVFGSFNFYIGYNFGKKKGYRK